MKRQYITPFLILFAFLLNIYLIDADPTMILVPGGEFEMGIPGGKDNPIHRVSVGSFLMAKYEVTAGEWRRFCEAEKIPFPWDSDSFTSLVERRYDFKFPDDWPIYFVEWFEAVWYCNWLSEQRGFNGTYEIDT